MFWSIAGSIFALIVTITFVYWIFDESEGTKLSVFLLLVGGVIEGGLFLLKCIMQWSWILPTMKWVGILMIVCLLVGTVKNFITNSLVESMIEFINMLSEHEIKEKI